MAMRDRINDEYFEWMFDMLCENRFSRDISFRKLLIYLHDTEFVYSIPGDENRAHDGIGLRRRFARSIGDVDLADYLMGQCSVLEMMLALSIRCEENIMDDPSRGDRTSQWFWDMIANLELGSMYDSQFDRPFVREVITRMLNRDYDYDGRGGLFTVCDPPRDMRRVEIWCQLCWYLESFD